MNRYPGPAINSFLDDIKKKEGEDAVTLLKEKAFKPAGILFNSTDNFPFNDYFFLKMTLEIPSIHLEFAKFIFENAKVKSDQLFYLVLFISLASEHGNIRVAIDKDFLNFENRLADYRSAFDPDTPHGVTDFYEKLNKIFKNGIDDLKKIICSNKDIFGEYESRAPFYYSPDMKYVYTQQKYIYEKRFLSALGARISNPVNSQYSNATDDDTWPRLNFNAAQKIAQSISDGIAPNKSGFKLNNGQKNAIISSLLNRFSLVSGGPGTGKTTTTVNIIRAILLSLAPEKRGEVSMVLAAPTGRAANRMSESIENSLLNFPFVSKNRENVDGFIKSNGMTMHQLLGLGYSSKLPGYDLNNRFPYDIILIDEASMVDLKMMTWFLEAAPAHAKVIMLGDKDQLPSVETGALLGDMIPKKGANILSGQITFLDESHRFNSRTGIGKLAGAFNAGNYELAMAAFETEKNIRLHSSEDDFSILKSLERVYSSRWEMSKLCRVNFGYNEIADNIGLINDIFDTLSHRIILSPSRYGILGINCINNKISGKFSFKEIYAGKPIMITQNDYSVGLFNGDRGLIFSFRQNRVEKKQTGSFKGEIAGAGNGTRIFAAVFPGLSRYEKGGEIITLPYKLIFPGSLPPHETSYAMTIHKSQGSEFTDVHMVIGKNCGALLSREILYTGLTRAKEKCDIYSTKERLKTAIAGRVVRHSGIREGLAI